MEPIVKSPYFEVEGHKFCSYCYAEMKFESGYEDQYYWEQLSCDCENAKIDHEMVKAVASAQSRLNEHRNKRLDTHEYRDPQKSARHSTWVKKKKIEILSNEIAKLESQL